MGYKIKVQACNNLQAISRGKPIVRQLPDGRYLTTYRAAQEGPTAKLVIWPKGEELRAKA